MGCEELTMRLLDLGTPHCSEPTWHGARSGEDVCTRNATCETRRPTSRISDGAPDLRRRVADANACGTAGRVHFIYLADRCMRLLGGAAGMRCCRYVS
jgi:hypothetical protein